MTLDDLPDLSFYLHIACVYLLKLKVKMKEIFGKTDSCKHLVTGQVEEDRQSKPDMAATERFSADRLDADEYLNTVRGFDYGKLEFFELHRRDKMYEMAPICRQR